MSSIHCSRATESSLGDGVLLMLLLEGYLGTTTRTSRTCSWLCCITATTLKLQTRPVPPLSAADVDWELVSRFFEFLSDRQAATGAAAERQACQRLADVVNDALHGRGVGA